MQILISHDFAQILSLALMYFSPNEREMRNEGADEDDTILAIEGTIIKQVTETKFLGVTIDDKLSWKPHTEILNKKLKSLCGRIYRIKRALPEHLYRQLYHTLFESHLSYAISVRGGISLNQIKPIFLTQKKCIRIMFGDNEARVRARENQKLGLNLYTKESSKPIFKKMKLLTVKNLYRKRCIVEIFKIIKYKVTVSMISLGRESERKECQLMTPFPSHNFSYQSAWLWNKFKSVNRSINFSLTTIKIKNILKYSLLEAQNTYGDNCCMQDTFARATHSA